VSDKTAKIAGAAALITILTVVARIAGFGRTFVFLRTVGDTSLGNVYNAANTIPNIVFELVAGGALASLVVPLLAGPVAAGDRRRVEGITSALLTWVLTLMVPIAVLVALAAGPIAGLLPGLPADQRALAADMLRVFAPQLPLYGVGIVLTGALQAHHRFVWPVIAPLLSSVTVIGAYLAYTALDGAKTGISGLSEAGKITLTVGTTLGVVVLALCLLIPLERLHLRLRPTYRFPGDEGAQAVRLGWAGALTVGSQQVVIAIIVVLTADDDLVRFNTAQTVFLLPWAVLAVPLATAVYPTLASAPLDRYRETLARAARTTVLFAGLGAAALVALAGPIARIVDAPLAAPGIAGFAPGLFGYALFALLSRALYARGATVAAAIATATGWGLAALSALILPALLGPGHQLIALALANAIGMSAIGLLLVRAVRRQAGPQALDGLARVTGVSIVAAGAAALAGWAVVHVTPSGGGGLLQGILGGVVVAVVFGALAFLLDRQDVPRLRRSRPRVEELQ
jgi:putative peptidoglycan lipid II flippase